MGRQLGHEGPTLQMGPEPTTAGILLEMASFEAKDSPLYISSPSKTLTPSSGNL